MFGLNKYLFIGIIFALPFFILNALVASGAPIMNFLRSETVPGEYEQVLILGLIFLIFIGGLVSLYPVIKNRYFLFFNILIALIFICSSVMLGYALGKDFYHCNILQIPNCD